MIDKDLLYSTERLLMKLTKEPLDESERGE